MTHNVQKRMKYCKRLVTWLLMLIALQLASSGVVSAYNEGALQDNNGAFINDLTSNYSHASELSWQKDVSQNQRNQLRSRNDVIREIKSRYNAEVLKISLSQNALFYNVRVLMPSGKVRNIQVNAER